jgi:hypothetical protein
VHLELVAAAWVPLPVPIVLCPRKISACRFVHSLVSVGPYDRFFTPNSFCRSAATDPGSCVAGMSFSASVGGTRGVR